ncbi:uncharacterized protein V2V93DRAFT_384341 [Kockiozyma suomiensis]|uniref:uncharacterized protein n=1 Tax=Kockiozyma suomiensis TaxID=1337062 RepID=UPI003342FB9C
MRISTFARPLWSFGPGRYRQLHKGDTGGLESYFCGFGFFDRQGAQRSARFIASKPAVDRSSSNTGVNEVKQESVFSCRSARQQFEDLEAVSNLSGHKSGFRAAECIENYDQNNFVTTDDSLAIDKEEASSQFSKISSTINTDNFLRLMQKFEPSEIGQYIHTSIKSSKKEKIRLNPTRSQEIWQIIRHAMSSKIPGSVSHQISLQITAEDFNQLLNMTRFIKTKQRHYMATLVGDLFFENRRDDCLQLDSLSIYIAALGRSNRFSEAFQIWQRFYPSEDADLQSKIMWMELRISLFVDQGKLELAAEAARSLQKFAGKLSPRIRTKFFVKLCEVGNMAGAERVYKDMIQSYVATEEKLDDEQESKKCRSEILWHLITCGKSALDTGNPKLSQSIIQDYELLGGELDGEFALVLVDRLSKDEVDKVFYKTGSSIRGKGVKRSADVSGVVEALDIASIYTADNANSLRFYELAMKRFCTLGRVEETVSYFKRSRELGFRPTTFMVYYLLRVILWNGEYRIAYDILEELESDWSAQRTKDSTENIQLCPLATEHYSLFIKYHLIRGADKEAMKFISRLRKLQLKPSVSMFNALLSDALHDHQYKQALDVYRMLQNAESDGILPDKHTHVLLWTILSRIQRLRARSLTCMKLDAKQKEELSNAPKISSFELRQTFLNMLTSGTFENDMNLFKKVFQAFFYSGDIATCLPLMEFCEQNCGFPLSDDYIEMFLHQIAINALQKQKVMGGKISNVVAPGVPREYVPAYPQTLMRRTTLTNALEVTLSGDLLEISHLRGKGVPGPISWPDIMKLTYIWTKKITPPHELQEVLAGIYDLRVALNLGPDIVYR